MEDKNVIVKKELPTEKGAKLPERVHDEKKVKIIIDQQEGEENQDRVFISVNGYAYSMQRGVELEVPESVVKVLETSIQTKMHQNPETGEITYRDVPRFSFRKIQ